MTDELIDLFEFADARAALPDNADGTTSRGEFCETLRLDPHQVREYSELLLTAHITEYVDAGLDDDALALATADVFLGGLMLGVALAAVPR